MMRKDDVIKAISKTDPNVLSSYEELASVFTGRYEMAESKKLGMCILALADTHGTVMIEDYICNLLETYPHFDIVALLGDHSKYELDVLLRYIPCDNIIGVLGNHDAADLYSGFGIRDIHGEVVEINGINLAGIGGSHRYKRGDWPLLTQDESLELCLKMLKNFQTADILITHDKAFERAEYDIAHTGLIGITGYVFMAAPVLHLHGHMHEKYERRYANGTNEICIYESQYLEI